MAMTGMILIFYRLRSREWFLQVVVIVFATFDTARLVNGIRFGLGHANLLRFAGLVGNEALCQLQQQDTNHSLCDLAGAIPGKFALACTFLPGNEGCTGGFNYIFFKESR